METELDWQRDQLNISPLLKFIKIVLSQQVRAGFQGAPAQPRAAWAQESWARSSPGTTEKGPSVYQLFRRNNATRSSPGT